MKQQSHALHGVVTWHLNSDDDKRISHGQEKKPESLLRDNTVFSNKKRNLIYSALSFKMQNSITCLILQSPCESSIKIS